MEVVYTVLIGIVVLVVIDISTNVIGELWIK